MCGSWVHLIIYVKTRDAKLFSGDGLKAFASLVHHMSTRARRPRTASPGGAAARRDSSKRHMQAFSLLSAPGDALRC